MTGAAEVPDWAADLAIARPLMGSGVLYRDRVGRLLLVKPSYKAGWDLPGGIVEPGESPLVAARREVVEELGVALSVGGLLVADWAPDDEFGDKVLWVFDGGVLDEMTVAALSVDGKELLEARMVRRDEVAGMAPVRLTRRIRSALDALETGRARYVEHGLMPNEDTRPAR